jgi:glyoxylase I family protein
MRALLAAAAVALLAVAPAAHSQGAYGVGSPDVRVRYIVDDVPAAVAFYSSHLGFKLDVPATPFFAALSRGGVQLLLSPVKGPGGASQPLPDGRRPQPGGWLRLVLATPDLESEVDRLRKAGVSFRNEIIGGLGGKQILLDDPSGNPVELFQPG